jgi:hypothetical protein
MTKEEIINGSKLIAEYLGWQYIPFNDLQGYSKAGWWRTPIIKQEENPLNKIIQEKSKNHKDKLGSRYYVCRNHSELRFYNSFDAIIPVIQKIEKEGKVSFYLNNNGCGVIGDNQYQEFHDKDLTWIQNTFNAVVKYLENEKSNNRL